MTAGTAPDKAPNPFVGPRAIRQGEPIYGRDHEVLQLLDLLIAERIVLLYSPSGAGKTSLIQAGLIPMLQREGFGVLPVVRVGLDPGHNLTVRSGNRYLASALFSLEGDTADGEKQRTAEIDQVPLGAYLERRGRSEGHDNQVLVIDALEELLTRDPTDGPTKQRFMTEVGEVLRDRKRWALFAVREDYLGGLEPYLRHVPTRLATTFRLNLLEAPAARAAMQSPARAAGVAFSDAAASRLVDNLRSVQVQRPEGRVEDLGPYVEPVQLQVVCRRLWERLPPGATEIGTADVDAVGDVDRALAGYYAEQVAAVAHRTRMQERTIREWFDRQLITEQGFRGQVLQGPGGDPEGQALRLLEDAHLVRSEQRRGATWFELTHDRLVQPIRTDNAVWRVRNLSALQRQAALWNDQHRGEGLLLRGDALVDAERRLQDEPVELSATERQFLDACRALALREREAARRQRRLRWLTACLAALLVLTLVTAGVALQQRNRARSSSAQASAAARLAASGQLTAEAARTVDDDPRTALLLAIAAQQLHDDADTRASLVHSLTSTRYAGTFAGHQLGVNSVALSPDGGTLATAGADGTVFVWDVARRAPVGQPLSGHRAAVWSVAFSPDRRTLATAGADGTVVLWDLARRAPLGPPLRGHAGEVTAVAFGRDGRTLASAGKDKVVRLWDVARRAPAGRPLTGHSDTIWSVAFSPDGRTLASGGRDKLVRLWDLTDPARPARLGRPLGGHEQVVNSVAFSPDGRTLASGSSDHTVILRDLTDRAHPVDLGRPLTGHSAAVWSVAFSPDGRTLATGSYDTSTILWNMANPARPVRLHQLNGHRNAVTSVVFSPDGRSLVTGSLDSSAIRWDVEGVKLARRGPALQGHGEGVASVAFSRDRGTLATAGADGTVVLWDLARRAPLGPPLRGHAGEVTAVAFSPDGGTLATAGADGTVMLWEVTSPAGPIRVGRLTGHEESVNSVAFSPDGRTLASGGDDRLVRLWDVTRQDLVGQPLTGNDDAVNSVAFSPDGRTLVSGGDDRLVRLWDLTDRARPVRLDPPLQGHDQGVAAVAFSPDGATLASGGDEGNVIFWDVANRTRPARLGKPLTGHRDAVAGVAFSPDGRTLASGGDDRRVMVWDAADRARPARLGQPLTGHGEAVTSVAFSPDGRTLVAGIDDGTAVPWNLTELYALRDGAVDRACSLAGGGLDREEWSRYVSGLPYEATCSGRP
jgi:WD40 repeat protein